MKADPRRFYVYLHSRADTGEVFYVGKGCGKRGFSRAGRNVVWQRIVARHGFEARITRDNLTEDEAFSLERELVAQHRAQGWAEANLTDGGEGPAGRTFSDETKAKMAAAKLGRTLSDEHKAKIGAAHIGRLWPEERKAKLRGRQFTQEHRDRIRASATGRKMSAEAVEKMAQTKRGVRQSEETVAKRAVYSQGKRNPHHCARLHLFVHPEHGSRRCTQYDLRTEFGLPHGNLSKLVAGARNMVHGWQLAQREAA